METQDHKKAASHSHSGHEGHHVCHKCGWPFPNPHPSARHRRAHKRVCGTIDGYKLDNDNNSDSRDKITPHLEGSDGEQLVSDDDHKIPPSDGKVVERTISRRSSSGVDSRSSRSIRSDDDVFADAVTEFTESPAVSRENSLQNVIENEPDGDRLAVENAIAVLEGKLPQGIQALEDENETVETELLSHDHFSGSKDNPVLVYASVPRESENANELNMMQASKAFSEPEVIAEEAKEIGSSKNDSKHGTGHGETGEDAPEDVPIQTGASEELLYSVSPVEMGQNTGLQTLGSEDRAECYHEVDSSGNSQASLHSVQVVEAADGDTSKSLDLVEEHGSLVGANENAFVLAVPDSLHIHEHPEIPVDELDHKGGKVNVSMAPDTTLAVERVEHGKPHATEERSSSIDFTKQGESSHVCSLDDVHDVHSEEEDMLEQEVKHKKSTVERNTVGEQEQISDVKTSNADVSKLVSEEVFEIIKNETGIDQKSTDLSAFSEVAAVGGGDDMDANACDSVRDNVKHSVVHESDVSKVSVQELAATNSKTFVQPAADDIAPNDEGLVNVHERDDNGCDEKAKVEGTALNENEVRIGEAENKPSSPETASDFVLTMTGSDDKNDDLFELERNSNHEKLNTVIDSGNVMVVRSQVESPLTSPYVGEMATAESNTRGEKSLKFDKTVDAMKIDGHLDSNLNMSEDAGSSFSNSAAGVDHISGKLADNASDVNEGGDLMTKQHSSVSAVDVGDSSSQTDGLKSNKAPGVNEGGDRNTKQHALASAVDVGDSGSQTDSLEGNWGSVSVLSAVSDALPVTDTAASNNSEPSTEAGNVSLDPKAVGEAQHSEGKTSVEPDIEFTQRESASEIQSQQQSSALHTGWSSSAANLANEPLGGGRRDEEIIAKVNDWSDGKQHTALKTLLGEAIAKSRAESPNNNEDSGSMSRVDEIPVTNNGFSAKTEKSSFEAAKEEMGKEWNSPARYPVNIKTEKRRAKSRPYWAPFLCCSSVNAR